MVNKIPIDIHYSLVKKNFVYFSLKSVALYIF